MPGEKSSFNPGGVHHVHLETRAQSNLGEVLTQLGGSPDRSPLANPPHVDPNVEKANPRLRKYYRLVAQHFAGVEEPDTTLLRAIRNSHQFGLKVIEILAGEEVALEPESLPLGLVAEHEDARDAVEETVNEFSAQSPTLHAIAELYMHGNDPTDRYSGLTVFVTLATLFAYDSEVHEEKAVQLRKSFESVVSGFNKP